MGNRLFRQEDTNRLLAEALDRAKTATLSGRYTEKWVAQRIAEEKDKYEAAKREYIRRKRFWNHGQ
jgi:hypothetical protein